LAKQGKISHSLFSKMMPTRVWIIDTGASDHMTGDLDTLSNFKPCDQKITVFMADGTSSLVQGRGTAYVAGIRLESVLYVPNLRCNLLSVSKITQDKGYLVIFSFADCIFQDKSSRRTIGKAEEKNGLYQISRLDHHKEFRLFVQSSLAVVSDSTLML